MDWTDAICLAIRYIEDHITDELTVDMIADHVNMSSFYFQKGFAMLCGFTISCVGPLPETLQNVNTKIFTEWLPAIKEYEFAAGYCVEMYDYYAKYPNGTKDESYYSEIWIPVKQKG